MRARIALGEYKPDQPAHANDGLVVADGVLPLPNGYRPLGQFSPLTNGTLSATCLGAVAYRAGGVVYIFSGSTSSLLRYQSTGWTTLGTGYAASTSIGWRFQEAAGLMLATNGADSIKKFNPASPASFTNLGGSPKLARYLTVVRGFVVAGYYDNNPLNIDWSGNGLPESWTPGTDESGEYEMDTGGDIVGVTGGEFGLIFQEGRIVRMTYTADEAIWQWDEISPNLGCQAPWSIAQYGKLTFFLSPKGWMVCDGNSVTPIGDEKIDRAFLSEVNRSYLPNMSAAVDQTNGLLFVAVPNGSPSTKVYIYHITAGRWSTATLTTERIFPGLSLSVTLEQLDATYPSLDAMTTSLDDSIWRGGSPELFVINGSHALGALTGSPMAATLTLGERELVPARKARVRRYRPATDAASVTLTVSGRNRLSASQTSTAYSSPTSAGEYPVRENWNLIQESYAIAAGADWSFFQGFDVEFEEGGRP